MSIARVNWAEIEKKYVFGIEKGGKYHFPSYGELDLEYGVNKSTIQRRSKREGWEIKREAFRNKNRELIEEKRTQRRARNATAENATMQRNAENVAQDSAGVTQEDINEQAERFSQEVMEFDRQTAQIAETALRAIRHNLIQIEASINAQGDEKAGIKPDLIQDNMKALEIAQKVFKNAIGEGLPGGDGKIVIEVISSREKPEWISR